MDELRISVTNCSISLLTFWKMPAASFTASVCAANNGEMPVSTSTVCPIASWISSVIADTVWIDSPEAAASSRISPAMTMNPLPADPARDASIEALRDNIFVCFVISTIGARIDRIERVLRLSLSEFSSSKAVIRATDSVFSTSCSIYDSPRWLTSMTRPADSSIAALT
ncbi:hypothetical protein D3C74_323070 [compost metagenome]